MQLQQVSQIELDSIIDQRTPIGIFFVHTTKNPIEIIEDSGFKTFKEDEDLFIGVDNRTGDAWTEEFDKYSELKKWLE